MRTHWLPLGPSVMLSRQNQLFPLLRPSTCPGQFLGDHHILLTRLHSSKVSTCNNTLSTNAKSVNLPELISTSVIPLHFERPSLWSLPVVPAVPLCLVSADPTSYSPSVFAFLHLALHQERTIPFWVLSA